MSPDLATWAIALLLKSSLLLAAAAVTARCLLRTASQRRLLWALAFASVLALPAGELLLPQLYVPLASVQHQWFSSTVVVGPLELPVAGWVLVLWMIGALWALVRVANDWRAARAVLARSQTIERNTLPTSARAVLGGDAGTAIRVAWTEELVSAAAIGWREPTILLPRAAMVWSADMLRAALVHEVEHIRQRDWLLMLVERLAVALFWPNPLVWAARHAAVTAREIAADDAVLRADVSPTRYARQLLDLSQAARAGTTVGLVVGLGGSSMVPRVRALFSSARHHDAATQRVRRIMVATTVLVSLPVVALQPMRCIPTNSPSFSLHLS
ncbi:MAG: M56 family metallopeptidase [Gemmatimonadaceae bacterium]|nr:M56 family metallopeptidase [Gemmatimonadaceae bacterium]